MTFLLDTNALLALGWENHQHHKAVTTWLRSLKSFATCPFTEGGFIRISSHPAFGYAIEPAEAFRSLDSIVGDYRHVFWPDDLSFDGVEIRRNLIHSHALVTDIYLVALAHRHKGSLATFDQPLARAFSGDSRLVVLIR